SAATLPDSPTVAGRWTTSPTSSFVPWRVPQTPPPSRTRPLTACSETTSRSTRCSRTWPRPSPGRSASIRCRRRRRQPLLGPALTLSSRDFTALAGRGSLALSRHDFAGALTLGRRALAIDASNPFAMGVVVDANVELGRYAAARGAIERLLRQRPDLASYSRASYYLELHGRTAAARRALVQATQAGAPPGDNPA